MNRKGILLKALLTAAAAGSLFIFTACSESDDNKDATETPDRDRDGAGRRRFFRQRQWYNHELIR